MIDPSVLYRCSVLAAMLASLAGCANWRFPRIDPSGERVFLWDQPAAPAYGVPGYAQPCPPGAAPGWPQPNGSALPSAASPPAATLPQPTLATPPAQPGASPPPGGSDSARSEPAPGATPLPAESPVPSIRLRLTSPGRTQVGQTVRFDLSVTNAGSLPATNLLITSRFDDTLEHAAGRSPIERDLGELAAGETRDLAITFKATKAGRACLTVDVTRAAERLGSARACVDAVATPDQLPALSVTKTGPSELHIGEIAEFLIDIVNTGDTEVRQLRVADAYERTLQPIQASDGYEVVGGQFVWTIERLAPGQRVRRQINCRCLEVVDQTCNRVTVTDASGLSLADEACLRVLPAPVAEAERLLLRINDFADPVRLGGEIRYRATISNPSQRVWTQVTLVVDLDDLLVPVSANAPVRHTIDGLRVRFEPIAALQPGESMAFDVVARATRGGTARASAILSAQGLAQPEMAAESTSVFFEP